MKKILFLVAGCCFLLLGLIGIVVPVLPTTPFLLLTATCFAKGSNRFYRWFTGTRIYKRHLEHFVSTWSMTRKAKLRIIIPVTLILVFLMIVTDILWVRILIVIALLSKYYFFCFKIHTIEEQPEISGQLERNIKL